MHEMAITGAVVDSVVKYAEKNDAQKVVRVYLRIGELRDIVDDLMQGCFRYLARGTVADQAELAIEKVPLRAQCKNCHLVFPADIYRPDTLQCPDCAGTQLSIYSGKEFLIQGIEIV
ncbi:MAG: hydrogenase maturation nickel metallochaperone HypA [Eggerthellaceae bacterium]